jgi:hypothetical protein
MFNRIGLALLTVSRTSPFKIFLFLQHQSLYQSSYVSLVELTDWGGGGRGAKSFAIKKAWDSIDCSLFNPLWVKPIENIKKCAKTVHITTWLLVLLTLQHHYIQRTNKFLKLDDLSAPIYWCYGHGSTNILVQLVLAAPIGEDTQHFENAWEYINRPQIGN